METDGQVLTVAGPRHGGDVVFIATRLAHLLDRTSCRVPQVYGIAESDGQGAAGTSVKQVEIEALLHAGRIQTFLRGARDGAEGIAPLAGSGDAL